MRLSQRKLAGLAIMALTAATMITGTLAMEGYVEHKNNFLFSLDGSNQISLVGDYEEKRGWDQNEVVQKNFSVKYNEGESTEPVYLRIQVKEFMAVGKKDYTYSDARYMVDLYGNFIRFASYDEAADYVQDENLSLAGRQIQQVKGYFDNASTPVGGYWYIQTKVGDPNGQYGRFVTTGIDPSQMVSILDGVTAPPENPELDDSSFTTRLWNHGGDSDFDDYVTWTFGTETRTLTDWRLNGSPSVAQWILDDTAGDQEGWVYWGQPLMMNSETEVFLESVKLIMVPDASAYYQVRINLNSILADDIYYWENTPEYIFEAYNLNVTMFKDQLNLLIAEANLLGSDNPALVQAIDAGMLCSVSCLSMIETQTALVNLKEAMDAVQSLEPFSDGFESEG